MSETTTFWIQMIDGPKCSLQIASASNVDTLRKAAFELFSSVDVGTSPLRLVLQLGPEKDAQVLQEPDMPLKLLLEKYEEMERGEYDKFPILYAHVDATKRQKLDTTEELLKLPAQRFAALCRASPKIQDIRIKGEFPTSVSTDCVTELRIHRTVGGAEGGEVSHDITACLLDQEWPLFQARDQNGVPGTTILFRRESPVDRDRVARAIQELCASECGRVVAWIGVPGIAKSASLNDVLRILIQKLGEPGSAPLVGLRVPIWGKSGGVIPVVILWEWDFIDHKVVVSVQTGATAGDSQSELFAVSASIAEKKGVLLVEALDSETTFSFGCPTLISLSSRRANETLRDNAKTAGGILWQVVGPWSLEECLAAAWAQFNMQWRHLGLTWEEVEATVRNRWANVGGIPRFVLGHPHAYTDRLSAQAAVKPSMLNWMESTVFNVGEGAKLFMAPEPHGDSRTDSVTWRFLCPNRAKAFLELAGDNPDSTASNSLREFGLDWQVAEQYICESLLVEHKLWEWYLDCGGATKLNTSTRMLDPPPGFKQPLSGGEEYFSGPICRTPLRVLDPSKLYRSAGWRMVLGAAFSFSPADKTVFVYQVPSKKPKHHVIALNVSQCSDWRKALGMTDDWTLAIVCFLDKSHVHLPTTGITFQAEANGEPKHISDVPQKTVGFLVRAPFNPWDKPYAM